MRGTLLAGSIAGISVITSIYRETIRSFRWVTLEASGLVTHSERTATEPVAVVITSFIMILIACWVIWIDYNFELHQRVCERRCREIEAEMLDRAD